MPLQFVITNAGRAAMLDPVTGSTKAVAIASVGVSPTAIVAAPTAVALPGEVKRINTIAGDAVGADILHLIVRDESADTYTVRSFALYLADGTLFGLYGQAATILEKSAGAVMLLAVDLTLVNVPAANLTFGSTNFLNPPATTDRAGVVELATTAEAEAGTDTTRALTPAHIATILSAAKILQRLMTVDGSGSGLDADLLDGQDGSYYTNITARLGYTPLNAVTYSAGDVLTKLVTVDGAGSGLDADLLDGQDGSYYANIVARLGFTPLAATAYSATDVRAKLVTVDGAGSGVDADLLDGREAAEFALLTGATFTNAVTTSGAGGGLFVVDRAGTSTWAIYATANALRFNNGPDRVTIDSSGIVTAQGFRRGAATLWDSANDGAGSGLDADLLDGQDSTYFTSIAARLGYTPLNAASYTAADVLAKLLAVDGAGSGVDADLLDGRQGAEFALKAGATFTGPISIGTGLAPVASAELHVATTLRVGGNGASDWFHIGLDSVSAYVFSPSGNVDFYAAGTRRAQVTPSGLLINGNSAWHAGNDGAGSGLDADLLDGRHASDFALATGFAASLSPDGYQLLPNGLVLQWVTGAVMGANSQTSQVVTFPITFNQVFRAFVSTSIQSQSNTADAFFQIVGDPTASNVTVLRQVTANATDTVPSTPIIFVIGR